MERRVDEMTDRTVRRVMPVTIIAMSQMQRRQNQRPDDEYDSQQYGVKTFHEFRMEIVRVCPHLQASEPEAFPHQRL